MKPLRHILKSLFMAATASMSLHATADGTFSGDLRLSCEAILCLSTGSAPGECNPALSRYYGIDYDDFGDTLKARLNFLNICPVSAQTPQMQSLVQAIVHGAGRCDAASLNATLIQYVTVKKTTNHPDSAGFGPSTETVPCISQTKPGYCAAYEGHEYTDLRGGAHYQVTDTYQEAGVAYGTGAIGNFSQGAQSVSCGHWVD